MEKLGLFCGCFDPVHSGHIRAAEACRDAFKLDEVLLIPAHDGFQKLSGWMASGEDRLAMCRLAVQGHAGLSVSDYELRCAECPYTMDTVLHSAAAHPGAELFLCLGDDTAYGVKYWACFEALRRQVSFLVIRRSGKGHAADQLAELGARVGFIDLEPDGLSSTAIRAALRSGANSVPGLDEKVLCYIRDKHLYAAK